MDWKMYSEEGLEGEGLPCIVVQEVCFKIKKFNVNHKC